MLFCSGVAMNGTFNTDSGIASPLLVSRLTVAASSARLVDQSIKYSLDQSTVTLASCYQKSLKYKYNT